MSLALAKRGLGPCASVDTFYTPYNQLFYSKYQYYKLDENKRQIRLLVVKPRLKSFHGHHTATPERRANAEGLERPADLGWKMLACELLDVVSLSVCAGRYCALSYAAGNPNNTLPILVDGFIFNAFSQLVHAIECALDYWESMGERQDDPLVLWVDQICINQSDPIERGQQVMMMRDIYSHSSETLVCLSTGSNTSGIPAIDGLQWFWPVRTSGNLREELWKLSVDDTFISNWLLSFKAFVLSPWWKRSWVYQEFVCSFKIQILYGKQNVSWELVSPHLATDLQSYCKEWSDRLKANAHQVLVHVDQKEIDKMAPPRLDQFLLQEQNATLGRLRAFMENTAFLMDQLQRAPFDASVTPYSLRRAMEKPPVDHYVSPAWAAAVARNFHKIHLRTNYQDCVATLHQERHRIWCEIDAEKARRASKVSEKIAKVSAVEMALKGLIENLSSREIQESLRSVAAMTVGRSTYTESTCGDLRDLLRRARNFQASDKRDKLYAFIGLSNAKAYGFRPEYSSENTVLHVFSDAARRILEHDGDLTYILQQATFGRHLTGFYLPSWVPNWACPEDRSIFVELEKHAQNKLRHSRYAGKKVQASSRKISSLKFSDERGGGKLFLHLGGYRVAKLSGWEEMKPRLRKFYVDSRMCVYASSETFAGDEVWVLLGSEWPVVLRSAVEKYVVVRLALICNFEETELSDAIFGAAGRDEFEGTTYEHICLT